MPIEDTKEVTATNKMGNPNKGHTQTYEYLIVFSLYQTNYASIPNLPNEPDGSRPKQTWTNTWYIFRPDVTKAEERSGDIKMSTLFNEFGKDGWKLINSDVTDSVVVNGDHYGWPEAGIPILQRYIFMRRGELV